MPTAITPVATWTGTIPTPDDGEAATGAGLDAMAQPLADRTEYLKAQVDTSGVKRIRKFDTINDMKTSLGASTGDMGYVLGYGIYRYNSAGVGPDDQPWTVEHDLGGLWSHEHSAIYDVEFPTLTGGRVTLAQAPPNATVLTKSTELSGVGNLYFTSSSTWIDATGASCSLTDINGSDVVLATLSCRAILGAAPLSAGVCKIRLAYELLGVTTSIAEWDLQELTSANDVPPVLHWTTRKAIASVVTWISSDPHVFKVQLISDGTTQARLLYPFSLVLQQVRP